MIATRGALAGGRLPGSAQRRALATLLVERHAVPKQALRWEKSSFNLPHHFLPHLFAASPFLSYLDITVLLASLLCLLFAIG